MFKNHKEIKFSNLSLILLGITICLWSTTWELFNIIKSSDLFYLSIILISIGIFLFHFDLRQIQISIIYLAILFLSINTLYFLIGINEYISKGYNIFHIIEYFIKQNISIVFCLFFSQYLFNEENIDKFIKTVTYTYIIIFSILICVYLFIYKSDYIGTRIDFDLGRNRTGKNTLGVFITFIFPFILTYITKSKSFLIGSIFLVLYFIMIYKIKSSTIVIVSLFQLALYSYIFFRKFFLRLLLIIFCLVIIIPNLIQQEFKKSSNNFDYDDEQIYVVTKDISSIFNNYLIKALINKVDNDFLKGELDDKPFIILDSHRGKLLYSGLQKVKNDFFVGSGLQSFRIRDDNFGSLTETHNTYLSILVDTGILGLILYLFFYFFILIRILKKKKYLKLMDYDLASIIYILSLLLAFNFINYEYTLSIWLLNGICLTRAFIK